MYFAINSPLGARPGATVDSAAELVRTLGLSRSRSPGTSRRAARAVDEQTLISRTGGAPTLAVGIWPMIFSEAFGGPV